MSGRAAFGRGLKRPKAHRNSIEWSIQATGNMLTDEEIAALKKGDAALRDNGKELMNLNADLSFPTGTSVRLYHGRKYDVLGDRLLGLDKS